MVPSKSNIELWARVDDINVVVERLRVEVESKGVDPVEVLPGTVSEAQAIDPPSGASIPQESLFFSLGQSPRSSAWR